MTRGSEPGTGTSRAHIRGTWAKPSCRAATAGNWASRSSVSVNRQLTTSSGLRPLRDMISRISVSVASRISSELLRSTVVAPLRAKSRIGAPSCQVAGLSHVRPARCAPERYWPTIEVMAPSAARRALVLGLLAGCLAVVPFLRDGAGDRSSLLPICLAAIAACSLLTAALLATQFLGRGSSQLLGLGAAYLAAGLLATVHLLVLPGALTNDGLLGTGGEQAPAWLWAIGHGWLPLGLAIALWGGPLSARRRLAGPTARRGRAVVLAYTFVTAAIAGLAALVIALDSSLPTVVDGDRLSTLGLIGASAVLTLDLLALTVVARRGRRNEIERRLLVVVACVMAATALTLASLSRDTVGWYASSVLDLVASALLLSLLLGGVRQL